MPPFASVLKSKDVEDPINVYMHRTLAYLFVKTFFRTPLTPNMITFLSLIVGIAAGVCWAIGTPRMMVLGGILLWASAILDGADGIMARAKNMASQFGRALDGVADQLVGVATVFPAFYHLYVQSGDWRLPALGFLAILGTTQHLLMFDFYKESYMRMTRLGRGGESDEHADLVRKRDALKAEGRTLASLGIGMLAGVARDQLRVVRFTNPWADREAIRYRADEETAAIYRKHNLGPMRIWAAISSAPHAYLMAICGMLDRLDLYLWIRLVLMNVLYVGVTLWQRSASRKTYEELKALGAVIEDRKSESATAPSQA